MKIAFFSNCYLPYLSGITISIKTLRESLEALGHEVFVVGPEYPNFKETDRHVLRLPSIPAPYPGYRFVFPFSAKVFKQLKEEKIDIIHAHQPFGIGLSALYLSRKLQIPLVYTFHTLFPRYVHNVPFVPSVISKAITVRYLRFFCNQVNAVIAPSTMVKRYLKILGVKKPIEVVPTGVNVGKIQDTRDKAQILSKHQIPNNSKILLFSGRISEEKNILFLIKAFPSILEKAPGTYLVLCGGGPKEAEYRKFAKQFTDRIIFAGQIPHTELTAYYQAADLFVYSSISETQGLVLCEAKANGLPIVALFGGGLTDVVESGIDGYLVPRNPAIFVEHVVRLLNDDQLRAKMATRAKEDALARFSPKTVANKMISVYQNLAGIQICISKDSAL
ncbi:MAG: glycosyltransferase [Candidatus Margulisiibacteriota bacterium]